MERRIGIALSGGGYRAAAWGLGTLLYLADARLNHHILTSSSVSGGSITNAAVALQPYRAMEPEAFWKISAGLARRLAGDIKPFLLLLGLHVAAWLTAIFCAATHRALLVAIALGVAVLLSLLFAPICRDATFASRLVWLYFDLLSASLALVAFAVGEGLWWLPALVLAGIVLLFRGVVVGQGDRHVAPASSRRTCPSRGSLDPRSTMSSVPATCTVATTCISVATSPTATLTAWGRGRRCHSAGPHAEDPQASRTDRQPPDSAAWCVGVSVSFRIRPKTADSAILKRSGVACP